MISRHDTLTSPLLSGADRRLTPKQQRFIQKYTVDLNGTQAAIRAGYSPMTARSIASEKLAASGGEDGDPEGTPCR